MNFPEITQTIQQEASQCVKCGLCLPHCPTYIQTQNECESPRGRIALMDGLASKKLPLTEKLQTYLDHCLTCRACESVCPANVQYGKLIDHARALITGRTKTKKIPRILEFIVLHPLLRRLIRSFLRIYQRCGVPFFIRNSKRFKRSRLVALDALLPRLEKPIRWRTFYAAEGNERGRVALFLGCIGDFVDQSTLAASIKILTYCGYGVYVPRQQRCCGALHLHAGDMTKATQLACTNLDVFQQTDILAIITVASGCTAVLQEYSNLQNSKFANRFSKKILDISQFLTRIEWPSHLKLRPLRKRVVLHTPCTLRHVLHDPDAPLKLLEKIPEIELNILKNTSHCCGAAGLYMLQHPEMSAQLLQRTLEQLKELEPDIIATSNIGCNLHIAKALFEQGNLDRVVHPIRLVAAQLYH